MAEAAVEKGQVAPGSIVGERARFWRAGAGRALRGELPGQIADLLRPVVIFKRQFKGQHGEEVTGSRSVIEDGDGFSAPEVRRTFPAVSAMASEAMKPDRTRTRRAGTAKRRFFIVIFPLAASRRVHPGAQVCLEKPDMGTLSRPVRMTKRTAFFRTKRFPRGRSCPDRRRVSSYRHARGDRAVAAWRLSLCR